VIADNATVVHTADRKHDASSGERLIADTSRVWKADWITGTGNSSIGNDTV
jgi:hypothetical protein